MTIEDAIWRLRKHDAQLTMTFPMIVGVENELWNALRTVGQLAADIRPPVGDSIALGRLEAAKQSAVTEGRFELAALIREVQDRAHELGGGSP